MLDYAVNAKKVVEVNKALQNVTSLIEELKKKKVNKEQLMKVGALTDFIGEV
jgi:hypothetical protein